MKKIGILSDTHGYVHPNLFTFFKDCHEIWHVGDIGSEEVLSELNLIAPVKAVFGNCDDWAIRRETSEQLVFDCEEHKVAMIHWDGKVNGVWIPNHVFSYALRITTVFGKKEVYKGVINVL